MSMLLPARMALPTTDYAWKVGDKQEKKRRIWKKKREVPRSTSLSLSLVVLLLLPHYASLDLSWEESYSYSFFKTPRNACIPSLNGRNGSPTRLLMDYSRNEGTDYIPSLSHSPSLAVVSFLALGLPPFSNNKVSLFVFGFSSWISPYTSASAGESLYGRGRDHWGHPRSYSAFMQQD